jgi:hypothetical protein
MSTSLEMQIGVITRSLPAFCATEFVYKWYHQTLAVHRALFANNTCTYTADCKEIYVFRKLQRGLISMGRWCECWNIKISEDKTRAIYLSHRRRPVKAYFTSRGQNIPFLNHVNTSVYCLIKKITWSMHRETIITKDFGTFTRVDSLWEMTC